MSFIMVSDRYDICYSLLIELWENYLCWWYTNRTQQILHVNKVENQTKKFYAIHFWVVEEKAEGENSMYTNLCTRKCENEIDFFKLSFVKKLFSAALV